MWGSALFAWWVGGGGLRRKPRKFSFAPTQVSLESSRGCPFHRWSQADRSIGRRGSGPRADQNELDDPAQREIAEPDPGRRLMGSVPILIDEWQRVPSSWDAVRRSVDLDPGPDRFLLTGSASSDAPVTHSGAGRIIRVRMRPLSLAERGLADPTLSLGGQAPGRAARGDRSVAPHAARLHPGNYPLRLPRHPQLGGRALRAQLESYISRAVDKDFQELGYAVRNPDLLLRWMRAYAAASSTTATLETVRDTATSRNPIARLTLPGQTPARRSRVGRITAWRRPPGCRRHHDWYACLPQRRWHRRCSVGANGTLREDRNADPRGQGWGGCWRYGCPYQAVQLHCSPSNCLRHLQR